MTYAVEPRRLARFISCSVFYVESSEAGEVQTHNLGHVPLDPQYFLFFVPHAVYFALKTVNFLDGSVRERKQGTLNPGSNWMLGI